MGVSPNPDPELFTIITTSSLVKVEFSAKKLISARLLDKMKDIFL